MVEHARERDSVTDRALPDNSDPTGIGPPPPGAETRVEKGRAVTQGAVIESEGSGADGEAGG